MNNRKHDQRTKQGTSSVADQRKCYSRRRDELGHAAYGKEYLEYVAGSKSQRHQLIELVTKLHGNVQEHDIAAHKYKDETEGKNKPQLLRNGRKDKI